ncbi:Arm DNA-binding domain-containing protein [Caballeronia sordidicola]|uniref:Arm DNA-binding domain-containing protein n=1 Tax=Caballeronia sordidicola TaxID=196367 RepID=UPI001362073D|nr:Arm DNA-binding domain-containing protein [Caballeronia sordidicola]
MTPLKTQLSVTDKTARKVRDRLCEAVIRDEQPGTVTRRLPDGQGLDLLIHPDGRKWWRFKYRVGSNAKCLLYGDYPRVSLEAARQQRDKTRNLLAAGIDPVAHHER